MKKPHIAEKKAAVLDLKAGKYYWCACGLSKNQPFCDGSHKGTNFRPLEFLLEEDGRVAFCNCKHSLKGALCDGTHKRL